MTTTFRIGVDWTRKGVICWDAQPGDALNLLPKPLTYTTVDWRTTNVTSALRSKVASPYGFHAFAVQTGTGVYAGLVLGEEDTTLDVDTIPVDASSAYSAVVWLRGISGYSGVSFKFIMKDQSGASVATSSAFTLTSSWQQVSVSGTTGASATHVMLQVVKDNDATDVNFQAAGFMLVAGSTVPTGYNAGETADLYDNITDYVTLADWVLGMFKPYQEVANKTVCKLTLANTDKLFSPEYEGGDLYGNLAPFRPVEIVSDDGTTERTMWTGWIETIQPDVNQYGKRQVRITAAGPMLFFQDVDTGIELQENKRTDEVLSVLLDEVPIPPPLTRTALLDVDGYSRLDQETWLPDLIIESDLDQGKTTLAVAADNWVRQGRQSQDTFDVYRAISDVVAAERGRFLFDREGEALFWNRHNLLLNTDNEATFDDTMTGLQYNYADLKEFKNEIRVTCHPRTVSASDNDLLWQLEEPVTIAPDQIREIGASYRDDSDNRIGGKDITLSNVTFSEGSASVVLEPGANRAKITLRNQSSGQQAVLATCEVRGTKITDFGRMEATAIDRESIAYYGQRTMAMNLPSVDDLDYAQTIADFELGRRATPAGKVSTITLVSHASEGGNQHAQQLARTLGERIRVKETQTAHDADYYIIGEAHKLSEAGTRYETTWYLEGATAGSAWLVLASTDSGNPYHNCNDLRGSYHIVY